VAVSIFPKSCQSRVMVAGNISGEATTLVGNILTEAMAFWLSPALLVFCYGAAKTLSRDTAADRGNILKSKRERMRGPDNRISRPVVERLRHPGTITAHPS
jgi:hypothetical protein